MSADGMPLLNGFRYSHLKGEEKWAPKFRWSAVEMLKDWTSTKESDVWSFGMIMVVRV